MNLSAASKRLKMMSRKSRQQTRCILVVFRYNLARALGRNNGLLGVVTCLICQELQCNGENTAIAYRSAYLQSS